LLARAGFMRSVTVIGYVLAAVMDEAGERGFSAEDIRHGLGDGGCGDRDGEAAGMGWWWWW
jgi:hypothetical protein